MQPYGTGHADNSFGDTAVPYLFTIPASAPLDLVVANDVMQDSTPRPYTTAPLPPMDPSATSLQRVVLSSGTDQRTIVSSGGTVFTEAAEMQPAVTETPGPLFVLSSVAGTGLQLPNGFEQGMNWQDAVTVYIPPTATAALPCAAPLVATMQSTANVPVTVPAGKFQTTQVKEIVQTCLRNPTPVLTVFEYDRYYAEGVGPVMMTYTDSTSGVHTYNLVSRQLAPGAAGSWPLAQGNSWTYEVLAPFGVPVGQPVTVTVTNVTTVTQ